MTTVQDWIERNTRVTHGPSGVFAVVANSALAHAEHEAIVALFSSRERADEYIKASRLPSGRSDPGDRITRSFRRDSLLFNFNDCSQRDWSNAVSVEMPQQVPPFIAAGLNSLPVDPPVPDGEEPTEASSNYQHHMGITISDKYWR